MIANQLAPDEPLSPELVLVLPPELRAQVIARLGRPVRPTPRTRVPDAAPVVAESAAPSLVGIVTARFAQLALIFIVITLLTLAMSVVAHALTRGPQMRPIDPVAGPGPSGRSDSPTPGYREGVWKPV